MPTTTIDTESETNRRDDNHTACRCSEGGRCACGPTCACKACSCSSLGGGKRCGK